jgi:colicin import membrane protein
LRLSPSEPGIAVSGAAHLALLLTMILAFAGAKKFDDAQESIAVEVVTDSQFNEIMKGEKTAPAVRPDAQPRAEKVADITDTKLSPPVAEAKRDIPAPPPKPADPGQDDQPEPPKPVAALPPAQSVPQPPDPSPPEPPKRAAEPSQQTVKPDSAEAIEPPVKPKSEVKKDAEAKPTPEPPKKLRPVEKPPDPKQKANENPLAQVTKLLEQKKLEEMAKADPKPTKPKPSEETIQHKYDVTAITKLLTRDAPQQTASTARDLNQMASLGTASGSAAKMSPSLMGQLDEYMIEQYKRCWNPVGLETGRYMPKISVKYNLDGSLAGEPRLINPSADPASRALAESALRAVHICNPLTIPTQFQPYYQEWKDRTLSFNPEDFL